MKDILYTIAKDKNGELITAKIAEKGNEFYCVICESNLLLRKSGKIGKNRKRPHFAHKTLTPNCKPETALHFGFKNLLLNKLNRHLENKTILEFNWECEYCFDYHSGNLLKKIKTVKLEYYLKECRPDIALLDFNDKVFAIIEIVVTHKPEEKVIEFYKKNEIILIQINLKSDEDINQVDEKINTPDIVKTCFNPKCKICNNFLHKTKMTIVDGDCWKCKKTMKVAVVEGGLERSGSCVGPEKFSKKEIEFATSKGVIIREHYSNVVKEKYLANTCSSCGTFAGNFYLYKEYFSPAQTGELDSVTYDVGHNCNNCVKIIESNKKENWENYI
jgi:Competence protein CoiA-like family